jgi:hypothetical protein
MMIRINSVGFMAYGDELALGQHDHTLTSAGHNPIRQNQQDCHQGDHGIPV